MTKISGDIEPPTSFETLLFISLDRLLQLTLLPWALFSSQHHNKHQHYDEHQEFGHNCSLKSKWYPFEKKKFGTEEIFAWWFGISNWFGVTSSLLRSAHVFDLRLNNGKRRGWFNYPTIKPLNSLLYHSSQLLNCNIIFDWESLWLTKWYTSKKLLPIKVVKQKFTARSNWRRPSPIVNGMTINK